MDFKGFLLLLRKLPSSFEELKATKAELAPVETWIPREAQWQFQNLSITPAAIFDTIIAKMIEAYISLLCLLKALDLLTGAEFHIHRMNVLKAQQRLEPTPTIVLTGRGSGNVSHRYLFNNMALFFGAAIILLLLGLVIFSYLKRRSAAWMNSYQMNDGDILNDDEEELEETLDHYHVGKIVDPEARHRTEIQAFGEEECFSSQTTMTEDDDEESYEEQETTEDREDSEGEKTMAVDEDSEKDEAIEADENSEEEDVMEHNNEDSEEDMTMEDNEDSDGHSEEEEEVEKAEEKDDHNEFLEILGQFINDPSAPTEFPRPSLLLCDPRRNLVYEAVLAIRGKMDRLASENESLQKERLDHLKMIEELQIKNELEGLNENEEMAEKLQHAEGIQTNMERKIIELEDDIGDFQKEKDRQPDDMRMQTENLSGESSKVAKASLEQERRERELENQVKTLTEEVERLNRRRTMKKENGPSEAHGGTDAARLQRTIDCQADQIRRLRKKLLEMDEERRLRELDLQEWEKAVHTVRKENSELKVALEDLDRRKGLFTVFEERNKVLEGQVKELRREMVKNEKEKSSILKETENLRTQMNEAVTVRDVIRNEMEAMALQIQNLERDNKDYKKDEAYFEEWFASDYSNHCEDLEDCLGKMFEISDRHQLLLKEKLQLMRQKRNSEEF